MLEREGTAEERPPLRTDGSLDREREEGRCRAALLPRLLPLPLPLSETRLRSEASLERREPLPDERIGGRCIRSSLTDDAEGGGGGGKRKRED